MYYLCYNDDGAAVIVYAAEAPDLYDNEFGYDNRADALAALGEL